MTSSRRNIFTEPGRPLEMLDMAPEMIVKVAIRILDMESMCRFAQVCKQLAGLSRVPKFVSALTEAFVVKTVGKVAKMAIRGLLDTCARLPVAAKIDLLEEMVNCYAKADPADEPSTYAWLVHSWSSYGMYYGLLNESAKKPETLNLELAHRFFGMLEVALKDVVSHGVPPRRTHLEFAKMLPTPTVEGQ